MLFENLIILIIAGAVIFMIGIPIYKFIAQILPKKNDPLADAKNSLERARVEVEAAKLHKKAEELYDDLYEETLQNKHNNNKQN